MRDRPRPRPAAPAAPSRRRRPQAGCHERHIRERFRQRRTRSRDCSRGPRTLHSTHHAEADTRCRAPLPHAHARPVARRPPAGAGPGARRLRPRWGGAGNACRRRALPQRAPDAEGGLQAGRAGGRACRRRHLHAPARSAPRGVRAAGAGAHRGRWPLDHYHDKELGQINDWFIYETPLGALTREVTRFGEDLEVTGFAERDAVSSRLPWCTRTTPAAEA